MKIQVFTSWAYMPGSLPTGALFKFRVSQTCYRVGAAGNLICLRHPLDETLKFKRG